MTQLEKAQRVCLAAADYIEAHGWTRGEYVRHGRVCLHGALKAVEKSLTSRLAAERLIVGALGMEETIGWNDLQKTRRPVLAALRRAGGQ